MPTQQNRSIESTTLRTHLCANLRATDVGSTVTVCGWVARRREHGEHLAFLDVRDYSGIVQCVVDNAVAFSYTHLTLPTNRAVMISAVA